MPFYICNVAVAPLRLLPEQGSEMVSSLVFGEKFELLEIANAFFAKIINKYDRYEGYVALNQISQIAESYYHSKASIITSSFGLLNFEGEQIYLPAGCMLTEGEAIHFDGGTIDVNDSQNNIKNLETIAKSFLNTCYLWGGKTSFGADCSGFVQTVYKMLNITLPRDASMQAKIGDTVDFLETAKCGDIAFFDNEEGNIIHVGILLNSNTIIHSAGRVKIDAIDSAGIITKNGERSHKLRIIKSVF
jgi:gamma-D-glutamyl-L-lysine dipeptidyl-peptidase